VQVDHGIPEAVRPLGYYSGTRGEVETNLSFPTGNVHRNNEAVLGGDTPNEVDFSVNVHLVKKRPELLDLFFSSEPLDARWDVKPRN
jgi:hypothetical protein